MHLPFSLGIKVPIAANQTLWFKGEKSNAIENSKTCYASIETAQEISPNGIIHRTIIEKLSLYQYLFALSVVCKV
jgi:hypothetical protein